jgi:hypothetical protein
MKLTPQSQPSLNDSSKTPEGRLLSVKPDMAGHHLVKLDNGPVKTITIMTNSEDLPSLLGSDLAAIRAHLMSRQPGHFRRKA